MLQRNWISIAGTLWLVAAGCGRPQGDYAPVEGILTVGGKPIERAEIVLSLTDRSAAGPKPVTRAVTDNDGRFVLKSITPDKQFVDGAVVGKHRVLVSTRIVDQDAQGNERVIRKELLSPQYTNGESLTVDVPPEGIEELRLDLPPG
jgi:hypothetical protein